MTSDRRESVVASDGAAAGRRLWVRFGLTAAAAVFLYLSTVAFEGIIRGYVTTRQLPVGLVLVYIGLAVVAGFSFGLAVVLPRRVHPRNPRRALVLSVLPILVTSVNLLYAFTLDGRLGAVLEDLVLGHTLGLQPVAAVLLGVAAASAFAND